MWGHFQDAVLRARDEACEQKRVRRSEGDTWWWDEEVREVISRNMDVHKVMCWNSTEENRNTFKSMKHKARDAVSKTNEGEG